MQILLLLSWKQWAWPWSSVLSARYSRVFTKRVKGDFIWPLFPVANNHYVWVTTIPRVVCVYVCVCGVFAYGVWCGVCVCVCECGVWVWCVCVWSVCVCVCVVCVVLWSVCVCVCACVVCGCGCVCVLCVGCVCVCVCGCECVGVCMCICVCVYVYVCVYRASFRKRGWVNILNGLFHRLFRETCSNRPWQNSWNPYLFSNYEPILVSLDFVVFL